MHVTTHNAKSRPPIIIVLEILAQPHTVNYTTPASSVGPGYNATYMYMYRCRTTSKHYPLQCIVSPSHIISFLTRLPLLSSNFLVNSADRVIRVFNIDEIMDVDDNDDIEALQRLQDLVNRTQWKKCTFSEDGEFIVAGSHRQHVLYIWDNRIASENADWAERRDPTRYCSELLARLFCSSSTHGHIIHVHNHLEKKLCRNIIYNIHTLKRNILCNNSWHTLFSLFLLPSPSCLSLCLYFCIFLSPLSPSLPPSLNTVAPSLSIHSLRCC